MHACISIQNLKKNLKLIQKENKCRKVLTDHIINRICNSVTSAVRLRRSQGISTENTIKLAGDIRNCVNHVFGDHSKCADDFCKADSDVVTEPVSSTIITKIKVYQNFCYHWIGTLIMIYVLGRLDHSILCLLQSYSTSQMITD